MTFLLEELCPITNLVKNILNICVCIKVIHYLTFHLVCHFLWNPRLLRVETSVRYPNYDVALKHSARETALRKLCYCFSSYGMKLFFAIYEHYDMTGCINLFYLFFLFSFPAVPWRQVQKNGRPEQSKVRNKDFVIWILMFNVGMLHFGDCKFCKCTNELIVIHEVSLKIMFPIFIFQIIEPQHQRWMLMAWQ